MSCRVATVTNIDGFSVLGNINSEATILVKSDALAVCVNRNKIYDQGCHDFLTITRI